MQIVSLLDLEGHQQGPSIVTERNRASEILQQLFRSRTLIQCIHMHARMTSAIVLLIRCHKISLLLIFMFLIFIAKHSDENQIVTKIS